MEDNFYQTSSEKLFPSSKEASTKKMEAKLAYEKEAPIIDATIKRLETQVAFFRSIDSIKTENDPEEFMREVAVNKRVAAILTRELKRLEGEVKKYGKDPRG